MSDSAQTVKIEFFDDKGRSLGVFDIKSGSDHYDRVSIARENGINYFNKCILDNGRVTIEKMESYYIIPGAQYETNGKLTPFFRESEIWHITNNLQKQH